MRKWVVTAIAATLTVTAPAHAQSIGELKAQLQQTKDLLAQAEASGMDPSVLASLRDTLKIAEQSIREMEADAADGNKATETSAASEATNSTSSGAKGPVSMPGCAAVHVTAANYRTEALSGGKDVQLKTMCGQAFEYYAMYRRALDQGYSDADAQRTYDAHEKSARVANQFYQETRTDR